MLSMYDITLEMAREIRKGGIWEGVSDSSTTTTVTEATLGLKDGVLDGGTIWLQDETPPVTRIITTQAAGVITFSPAVAGLTGAQSYVAFGKTFPRHAIRDALNRALRQIGNFSDYALISSVGLQEDYALPAAVTGRVCTVEKSAFADPSTASNPSWSFHNGWIQIDNTLRFMAHPPALSGTNNLRLGFNFLHPKLTADSDTIRREVDPNRIIWEAVANAYLHLLAPRDSQALDEQTQNLHNRAIQEANSYPVHWNQPLPDPMLLLGVGSRGGAGINPDLLP